MVFVVLVVFVAPFLRDRAVDHVKEVQQRNCRIEGFLVRHVLSGFILPDHFEFLQCLVGYHRFAPLWRQLNNTGMIKNTAESRA